jgi:DNA-binding CsgD family transcriptional regulator
MLRSIALYGLALAVTAWLLQWAEYQIWARRHPGELYVTLLALGFMGFGVWVGARLFRREPQPAVFTPNLKAQASLGMTDREFEVLREAAAGRSNKEIARVLAVSPNTVKTHLARVFEKLGAARRTEAVLKARELGLIP